MVGGPVEAGYETPRLPPGYDPAKWIYDSRTNEFHKVTDRVVGRVLFNSATYEERSLAYVQKAARAKRDGRALFAMWSVTVILTVFTLSQGWTGAGIAAGFFAGMLFLTTSGTSIAHIYTTAVALPLAKANVGPPPPSERPGREKVESQKVHGEGGFLGGDRLRDAARGGSLAGEGSTPLETHDD